MLIVELLTIPFVAFFNTYTATNYTLMSILGITLGFISGVIIIYIIQRAIVKFISQHIAKPVSKLSNKLYIAILFALILGIMFFIQTQLVTFEYESLGGGLSTGISIFITLNLNLLISKLFGNQLYVTNQEEKYFLTLDYFDICYISFLGFIYELCAYKVSGLWLLYNHHQFFYGIISAVLASFLGALAVICISKYLNYAPTFILFIQKRIYHT